jgi:hypothetical protein
MLLGRAVAMSAQRRVSSPSMATTVNLHLDKIIQLSPSGRVASALVAAAAV